MQISIQERVLDFQKSFKQSRAGGGAAIRSLLESPQPDAWLVFSEGIRKLQKSHPLDIERALDGIYSYLDKIATFTMLLYVYSLKEKYRLAMLSYTNWTTYYQAINLNNNELLMFNSWISASYRDKTVQQSLEMVVANFISMFRKERFMRITQLELTSVVYWLCYFDTDDPKKYNLACDLAKLIKENPMSSTQDYLPKELLILKKIIELVGQSSNTTGNTFLLLYPMTLREKDINYFCNIEQDFLSNLAVQHLANVFMGLTKAAISRQILFVIDKLSRLLQSSQEYFKLRVIYQKIILPRIVKRAKSCKKTQEHVYEISRFYIMGFMSHCDLGVEGVKCIVENIGKISNLQVQKKWIEICSSIIIKHPQYKKLIMEQLRKQKVIAKDQEFQITVQHTSLKMDEIWEVTVRNGRMHKIYPKSRSVKYRGIENQSNQCYIISAVQGLFMTEHLGSMLNQNKTILKNLPLLDELRLLFRELQGKTKAQRIVVNYLKKNGPQMFSESTFQEDVQQYLLSLFDCIQNSLKKEPAVLKAFKDIFSVRSESQIKCKSCGLQVMRTQNEYIITITHDEVLKEQYTDPIQGYKCQKCFQKEAIVIRTLHPKCEVLMVHINRFEHYKGETKKLLSTQKILRRFMNYELKGIIFHYGRNVEQGHYIYYGKIDKQRWVQMNDILANQFTLDQEDEEFQRQMKCEMTPYILFYTRVT